MKVYLKAKVTETENCKGIWLNTITVQLADKSIVTLDRDTTEYSINGHNADIEFSGVYALSTVCLWDSEEIGAMDYSLKPEDFVRAKLLDWEVDDDADENYKLKLIKNSLRFGE